MRDARWQPFDDLSDEQLAEIAAWHRVRRLMRRSRDTFRRLLERIRREGGPIA